MEDDDSDDSEEDDEDDEDREDVGTANFPFIGDCKFTGTKISERMGPLAVKWTDFSLKAADEAN